MARKEIVTVSLTDDLTGEEMTEGDGVFVKLSVDADGKREQIEIDLSKVSYDALRELLAPYFEHGRVSTGKGTTGAGDGDAGIIRKWAQEMHAKSGGTITVHNVEVSSWTDPDGKNLPVPTERGRVPQVWKDAYARFQVASAQDEADQAAKAAENGTATESVKPAAKATAKK